MTRPRGRPPKYSEEEVRGRLFDAARAELLEAGVMSGLDAVNLDRAIADADVPRGSAYRLWRLEGASPQDHFRRAVAIQILRDIPTSGGFPFPASHADRLVTELRAKFRFDDPAEARHAADEIIRIVVGRNFEQLDDNRSWQIYNALRTAAFSRSHGDPELADALKLGEDTLVERYASLYQRIAESFGHTIRAPYTWNDFSAAAYALTDGLANRASDRFQRRDITLPTGPSGAEQDWTLVAIGFRALADHFVVPISSASAA